MGVGRKPVPSAINRLKGNPGRRPPLVSNEARPEPGGSPPAWLSQPAKLHWPTVARHLDNAGVLTKLDETALAMYCEAFCRWRDAMDMIDKEGMLVVTSNGFPVQSPWIQIGNKAFDHMRQMLIEFGMTPSSRTRVGAVKPAKEENPFDEFAVN